MTIEKKGFFRRKLEAATEGGSAFIDNIRGSVRKDLKQANHSEKEQSSSFFSRKMTRREFLEGTAAAGVTMMFSNTARAENGDIEDTEFNEIRTLEDYRNITLEELSELPTHQRLILLSPELRENYFFLMLRPANELVPVLLKESITIDSRYFEHGDEFNQKLSLANIIPEEISSLQTNGELMGFRIRDEFSDIYTAGEFYTSFRPTEWKSMSKSSKRRLIKQHRDLEPDDKNRVRFDNDTIIQCKESFEAQHQAPSEYLVAESNIDQETFNLEKQKLIEVIREKNEDGEYKFISKNMRAGDIFIMNIGVLRLLAKLIEEFGELIKISSARRSKYNNNKAKGSSKSKHLMGIGFDIVGATEFKSTNDAIVENVEAWLIAHGYNEIMKLLSHGSSYHLHTEPLGESTDEELLNEAEYKNKKPLDPNLDNRNPFFPYASKRTPGKMLQRLSLSDIQLLEATDYAPEVACSFCNGWEQKRAQAIFSSPERVKEMVEEAIAA